MLLLFLIKALYFLLKKLKYFTCSLEESCYCQNFQGCLQPENWLYQLPGMNVIVDLTLWDLHQISPLT